MVSSSDTPSSRVLLELALQRLLVDAAVALLCLLGARDDGWISREEAAAQLRGRSAGQPQRCAVNAAGSGAARHEGRTRRATAAASSSPTARALLNASS